ncbi:MAG: DUF4304 domain-containing protein [Acidobacteria bacterium]|nr:DUF4304 domain-containing protein [Acidobacteriota bacterium]
MNFSDFLTEADTILQQPMNGAGFRRVGAGNWNRRSGDDLNVVWLQKNSSAESFCVNLGVHYTFLSKAGTEAPLDEVIELPDCEIKLRLTAQAAVKDQWWPFNSESVREVVDLMKSRGLAIFDSYRLAGPIAEMEAKDIEAGNSGLLSSLTKVRACLLLARMHELLGNREKCIEAATAGVRLAGMAVGPKKALKEILKRNGQPV